MTQGQSRQLKDFEGLDIDTDCLYKGSLNEVIIQGTLNDPTVANLLSKISHASKEVDARGSMEKIIGDKGLQRVVRIKVPDGYAPQQISEAARAAGLRVLRELNIPR